MVLNDGHFFDSEGRRIRDQASGGRMRALRIIDTGLKPARWNVAMTAALVELHSKGGAGDLVRFHRYPPCVLIGATQKAERVADLEHCRRSGIDLVRRITGGGAV